MTTFAYLTSPRRKRKLAIARQATAGTALPSGRILTAAEETSRGSSHTRVDLSGTWQRFVEGRQFDVVTVPSSLRPLGNYRLQREFLLPRLLDGQRVILHFDAVNYFARVSVNGTELGKMGPYVPYEFECTKQVKEGQNRIDVKISDLVPEADGSGRDEIALGVNPGWEAYGGIIRNVYAELRPAAFISNVRFGYTLNSEFTKATCPSKVFVSSAQSGPAQITLSLWHAGAEVASAEKSAALSEGESEVDLTFEMHDPALWSPEAPNLCELRARVRSADVEDVWNCRAGFRDVAIRGNQFYLNGQRLVLNGLCRHDMWRDQGFTLTPAQMDQDMRMIKALGANFVRLVHYPHHRRIVELADELGLLVSEEPGFWGMDFQKMPPGMIEVGYQIMERVIRRDWNSPSVFAWLLGNECNLTVDYLREGKKRCRDLDPLARPVSFANSMGPKNSKPVFEQSGMDFFDEHLYPGDAQDYLRAADAYGNSRPLTFTEWGWEDVGGGGIFPETHSDLILDLVESGKLAGHCFWSWNDVRQYSRIDWPTQNGILLSGVVTEAREVRPDWYQEFAALFQGRRQEASLVDTRPRLLPLKRTPTAGRNAGFQPLDLQPLVDSPDGQESWKAFEAAMASYWPKTRMAQDQWQRTGRKFRLWKGADVEIAGIPFRSALADDYIRPLALTPKVPEFTIPVNAQCARLHILGQVTFPDGYPVVGTRGEKIATYFLHYANGRSQEVPVRNGVEVARANLIYDATRLNPIATAADRALEFVKDLPREHYQVLLLPLPAESNKLVSLRCRLESNQLALAIFAITAERA